MAIDDLPLPLGAVNCVILDLFKSREFSFPYENILENCKFESVILLIVFSL
jgi:hypothetical protein